MSPGDELPNAPPVPDERRYLRFRVDIPVLRREGERRVQERIIDISYEGMALATSTLLAPGDTLELVLVPPDRWGEVPVQATVQHVRASPEASTPYVAGLKLAPLEPRALLAYESLLLHMLMLPEGRRQRRRIGLRLEAEWQEAGSDARPVTLLDLSLTGARVSGPHAPGKGVRGELILVSAEEGGRLRVPAVAMWARTEPERDETGFRFELGGELRSTLARVLRDSLLSQRRVVSASRAPGGRVRIGVFDLNEKIGQGSTCEVYRATATSGPLAGRTVALKRLRAERAQHPDVFEHFIIGADLGRLLQHPSVAHVHTGLSFGDEHWVAMELVDGSDLGSLLARHARAAVRPSVEDVLALGTGLLDVLEYCHTFRARSGRPLGIVHGDVVPGNVMLSCDGALRLSDFGLGLPPGGPPESPGGRPLAYVAPELLEPSARSTPLVDVYQVAVLLYEALAGTPPFQEGSPEAHVQAVECGPPPLSRLNPAVPPDVEQALAAALHVRPERRPASARLFAERLEASGPCPSRSGRAAACARFYATAHALG